MTEKSAKFVEKRKDGRVKNRDVFAKRDKNKAKKGHPGRTYCIDDLSPMESLFVREYLIHNNAKRAAREAGYTNPASANNLLNKKSVAEVIIKMQKKRAEKLDITADRVLQEIAAVAFANLADVVDWGPRGITIKDSKELDEMVKRAVAEVSETVTGKSTTTKVKMHDKMGALDKLMKHLGLYPRDSEDNKSKKVDPLKLLFDAVIASRETSEDDEEDDKPKVVKKKKAEPIIEDDEDEDDEEDED